ncbi:putative clathrin assembly protein [Hibiscus syriacus]|uniref:Clathrin assembly protein n=1 Tax=Hibiscus syriacus TaxID=106335 RepID=A0A6A2ZVN6_HIBSY|nr:putative clathrin assembly protein [Hibiscus syriacus]
MIFVNKSVRASFAALRISRLRGIDIRVCIVIVVVVAIPVFIFGVYLHGQKITYFLRPLWESPPKPFHEIPHYYHENVTMETLSKLHGWKIRKSPRRVFDTVLFNNEIDIITLRWKELYPHRFKFIEPRLNYGMIGGRFKKGENPFVEEAYQRVASDQLIRIAKIEDDDLLIMSDADEIPSAHTINLLRCFCFRYISGFIFKMKAYSHTDRVRFSHYLNPKRIQEVICKGPDLFDMIPEEYTFKEIVGKKGSIPRSYSAVHLPEYLLNNAERLKYLLPGNCKRESG